MLLLPFAGCVARFRRPSLPPEPLPAAPFLDLHCHVAGLGAGDSGCFVSEQLRRSWKVGFYFRSFGVSRRELAQWGDARCADRLSAMLGQSRHVNRAVVLALDGAVDDQGNLDTARTEFYVPNEFVAALAARHTNLLFGASVNPYRPDALARLDRVIVSPWFFPLDLSLRQRWQISRIKNPWDRDVALKQALGVHADVFTRAEKLLRL
jgi:hypothetical protein